MMEHMAVNKREFMRLKNKVAIVTGGTRGIGFAVVKAFVREGAKVAICGSRIETAENAVSKLKEIHPKAKVIAVGANMSDGGSISQMVKSVYEKWGAIDILVNNAGVTAAQSMFVMSDEDFDSLIAINLSGPFKCTRETAKYMKDRGGSIINTSSMVSLYGGRCQSAYASSKSGINGLTKSCAKELGAYHIRVNAVAPGVVMTDMVAASVDERMMEGLKKMTPLGRAAKPDELAGAYVYLASDEAKFTTGAILSVDGGIVM